MPIFGINVTSRNGEIVHEELRRARVGFANVRLTSGLRSDARAEWNLENFRKNGIPTGVIHELTANDLIEVVAEADYFANELIKFNIQPELYTICRLDCQNELSAKLAAAMVSTFMERLNRWIEGLNLCVMGRQSQLKAIDESLKKSGVEPIFAYWCVDEPEKLRDRFNFYNDRINREESELDPVGWQFREFGAIEGCKGAFEQNFGYEGLAELLLKAKCGEISGRFIEYARENCRELVMKLANRVSTNRLSAAPKPLRLLSYEKQLLVVRWQCGLTPEETNSLNKFRGAPEIVNQVCRCVLAWR